MARRQGGVDGGQVIRRTRHAFSIPLAGATTEPTANTIGSCANAFEEGAPDLAQGSPAVLFNNDFGLPDDPATKALGEFVAAMLKK